MQAKCGHDSEANISRYQQHSNKSKRWDAIMPALWGHHSQDIRKRSRDATPAQQHSGKSKRWDAMPATEGHHNKGILRSNRDAWCMGVSRLSEPSRCSKFSKSFGWSEFSRCSGLIKCIERVIVIAAGISSPLSRCDHCSDGGLSANKRDSIIAPLTQSASCSKEQHILRSKEQRFMLKEQCILESKDNHLFVFQANDKLYSY